MASRRVPRASISVTALRDPDVITLRQSGLKGRAAWGDFIALILLAKDLGNGGRFEKPIEIVANLIHIRADSLRTSIKLITSTCRKCNSQPWIELGDNDYLVIRNFAKWNPLQENRGGARAGAGRPPKNQSRIRNDSKDNQSSAPPTRGIGIGDSSLNSEGESEGEFSADIAILRGLGPDDEITPGDRFTAKHLADDLWEVLPNNRRTDRPAFIDEVIRAIRRGHGLDEIKTKLPMYYASAEGRGDRWKQPANFLRDRLDDDPSAWGARSNQAQSGDNTAGVEFIRQQTRRMVAKAHDDSPPDGGATP